MKKSEIKSYICILILGFGIGLIIRPLINVISYINKTNGVICELPYNDKLYNEFNMKKCTGSNVRAIASLHDDLCVLIVNKELNYNKYATVNNLSLWSEDELQKDDYSYYIDESLFYDKLVMDDNHQYYTVSDFTLGTYCNSDLTVISSSSYVPSSGIYESYIIKTEAGETIGIVFFEL